MVYKGNMRNIEAMAAHQIPRLLREWLGGPVKTELQVRRGDCEADMVAYARDFTFVLEVKATDEVAALKRGGHQLEAYINEIADAVPVLVVPYMGPKARAFMESRSLSWLDLSGNADIRGVGLRIMVQGRPNRFATPGRPSTAFSPKASRVSRAMLVEPKRRWLQTEMVDATELSAGYVSKVVGRLLEDGLVVRGDDGRVEPKDLSLLVDAWSQVYDFSRHEISRYHAVGRSGMAVLERLASALDREADCSWAATGLAAARQLDRFADFRLVTVFVSKPLLDPDSMGLRPVERGENVWVVVPRDEGVFYGGQTPGGVRCVHPVQVYLDLSGHPERASEAAANLRTNIMVSTS